MRTTEHLGYGAGSAREILLPYLGLTFVRPILINNLKFSVAKEIEEIFAFRLGARRIFVLPIFNIHKRAVSKQLKNISSPPIKSPLNQQFVRRFPK